VSIRDVRTGKGETAMTYRIEMGRHSSAYTARFITENDAQARSLYHGLNIGRGYKKRLVLVREDGKRETLWAERS
jgi:hypothetical protein